MDRVIQNIIRITIPKGLQGFMPDERIEVLNLLAHRKSLPKEMPVDSTDDRDIFAPNGDPLMAKLENEFYRTLADQQRQNVIDLIHLLGFRIPAAKQVDGLHKAIKDSFKKLVHDAGTFTSDQLKKLDKMMNRSLPDYARTAEEFILKAELLGKIRSKMGITGAEQVAQIGDFLDNIKASTKVDRQNYVLTEKEKDYEFGQGNKKARILPLTEREQWATKTAQARAAEKVTQVSAKIQSRIRMLVTEAIENRQEPRQLESALFDELGDLNRDWRRVAITELAMAHNDAHLLGLTEGSTVHVPKLAGACKHCVELLEGRTFTVLHQAPDEDTHDFEMNYLWPGKTNYGRRVATWIPCIPLHPNCRHRAVTLSRFYRLDPKDNVPKLKSSIELIQEERLRRGLPPDPDIQGRLDRLKRELAEDD